MKLKFFSKRLNELDARVEDARQRAEDATREAKISRQRRELIEENVVKPLRQAGSHNQFAELIRQSLIDGRGNHA